MKKLSCLILCMLIAVTCILTGCAGFSINRVKYYNEVLAKVGDETITRFDLLNAYSSYGQNYYSGSSDGSALENTLETLIDRAAIYQYVKNNEDDLYLPTGYQVKEIVISIFDSLDGEVEDLIKEAKAVLNIKNEDNKESEETSEEETLYRLADYEYKKRAELVEDGEKVIYYTDDSYTKISKEETDYSKTIKQYKIVYITEAEPTFGDKDFGSYEEYLDEKYVKVNYLEGYTFADLVKEIKTKYLAHLNKNLEENEKENASAIYNYVLKQLSKNLINYEYYLRDSKGKPYSKDTDGLLSRYFERTLNSQIQSRYLTNYQEYYLANENLDINELTVAFKEIIENNHAEYTKSIDSYKSAMKGLSTNGDSILYHPNIDDDTQFGYFLHTLFKFSDEQKTELEKYKTTNPQKYLELILNTKVEERDVVSGNVEKELTLKDVLKGQQYQDLCNNPNAEEFVNFMFKYSQDPGSLSSGTPYVVGSHKENEEYSANSGMEEAFTEECIKLMKNNNPNSISLVSENSPIADFCITSYGVHIVYYVSPVYENDINYADRNSVYIEGVDRATNDGLNLYTKKISPLTNKTYFDTLFDKVYPASNNVFTSNTNYSKHEQEIVKLAKGTYKVTKYVDRIKATKVN